MLDDAPEDLVKLNKDKTEGQSHYRNKKTYLEIALEVDII